MIKSIVPLLFVGLIFCMSIIPSAAAVTDSGELWEQYGSGNSANLIVLSPDTVERIETPVIFGNNSTISAENRSDMLEVQPETKPEKNASMSPPVTVQERPLYDPGSIIVRFKPDIADSPSLLAQASDAMQSQTGSIVTRDYSDVGLSGMQMVQLSEDMSVPEAVSAYSQNPDVLYAEPNYYYYLDAVPEPTVAPINEGSAESVPDDPEFSNLWGLHNTGQTIQGVTGSADADIDAPEAWTITKGSKNVTIAVIDSGVMYTHPDLAANIWTNPGEIPDNGIDDDGNGYVDDVHGWDFYDNDYDPDDAYGHGTHCAGTIAAVGNNSIGVTGVMWNAKIMPLRFMGPNGKGRNTDAILAIRYATMMGADVISCSWGGASYSQALKDAIDATPALVVCAAGNDALNNDITPHYPSSYTSRNVLAVAASTSTEQLASFSNFGATSVDVAAPGRNILSTYPDWVAKYYDPMNSLDAWSADAPWGLNIFDYVSPSSAADDSPAGNYSPNTYAWLTTKEPIYLGDLQQPTLAFSAKYDLETNYDNLSVIASRDNISYYILGNITGSSGGEWYNFTAPLDSYSGGSVYIGFILSTDGSVEKDGVLIDDVYVVGKEPLSPAYKYLSGTSMATPHVSGVAGLVKSVNAHLNATEIKDIIINTVDTNPAYTGKMVSEGRVNAYSAVQAAAPVPPSIISSKDAVIRGNTFVTAITGKPSTSYWVYIKDAAILSEEYPQISPGQAGVTVAGTLFASEAAAVPDTAKAVITTGADGRCLLQFTTNTSTRAVNYTIKVVDPADTSLVDEVTIRVGQGAVTISAAGTGVYDSGDEIVLSGTNTDSATTYLFVTGPGLAADGARLDNRALPCVTGDASTFTGVAVDLDGTWEYRWDTGNCGCGNYTIYAVAQPNAKNDLADAAYGTFHVTLNGEPGATNQIAILPASSTLTVGQTQAYPVILDAVPEGLSGFNLTFALTDPSVGEIVAVSYPTWANMPENGLLPADTVYAQAVDLNSAIEAEATNITLCTLTVRSDAAGTTNLTITATKVDDDVSGRYAPAVLDAALTVQNIPPFPNPAGGNFPAPTDPNGDGQYEDLDGSGFIGFNDVVVYYRNMNFIESKQPLAAFDYDGSGFIGFNDVVRLYRMV